MFGTGTSHEFTIFDLYWQLLVVPSNNQIQPIFDMVSALTSRLFMPRQTNFYYFMVSRGCWLFEQKHLSKSVNYVCQQVDIIGVIRFLLLDRQQLRFINNPFLIRLFYCCDCVIHLSFASLFPQSFPRRVHFIIYLITLCLYNPL